MMDKLKNLGLESTPLLPVVPTISVGDMDPFMKAISLIGDSTFSNASFDGNKFIGGFGDTKVYLSDYSTLRQRSQQLFTDNVYARGILRRLITNEINTGLKLESCPIGEMLGMDEDSVSDWTDNTENRFQIWADNPLLCDFKQQSTFGKLQADCRREALIGGDTLVVIHISPINNLPQIEIIPGSAVQTPIDKPPRKGNIIKHGVEVDKQGRQVAYHVRQKNSKSKRVPAFGERSKRRIAWLVYGTDKRVDDLRGQPLLAIMLQSLREIDRFRDSAQRKALINSLIAMFIKKDADAMGSRPMTGATLRKDEASVTDSSGANRKLNFGSINPGLIIDELNKGETPEVHTTAGTDINFGAFEQSIVNVMAWCLEMPPGCLTLSFHSNYAASRGEVNEFKTYLNKSRKERSDEFTKPIYTEWLLSETLRGKIDAPGLLEAWRDPSKYDTYGAWIQSDWPGALKPNIDLNKEVMAYIKMDNMGYITKTRSTADLSGQKFDRVIKLKKRENKKFVDSIEPLLQLEKSNPNSKILPGLLAEGGFNISDIETIIEDKLEDNGTQGV